MVALLIGILLTISLFQNSEKAALSVLFDTALDKSGAILAVTAAGGAFGEIIKALDLGNVFGETLAASGLGLAIPFALAAIFKTAQGSSTVAVISTASIIAPLLPSIGLDTEGGISKFSKIDTATTLRTHSVVSALMAAVAFLSVWVASFIIS